MKENSKHSTSNWIDPDDAPELTPEMLSLGVKMVGDTTVSNNEFKPSALGSSNSLFNLIFIGTLG